MALKFYEGDIADSQSRVAKLFGREPARLHIVHSDGFGDFEDIVCPGCEGRGNLNGHACPACKCIGSLAIALKLARMECREAIVIMREDKSYDGGNQTEWEKAYDRFVLARAEMQAIARALKAGAR